MLNKQFGIYEIIRKLGRGMTDVYLAFDTRNNRQAVLKIVEESPDSHTQVIIEAERRGAALQKQLHEFDSRVIEVYEYGDQNGCFFIAMQYIEGKNIAEILREEKRIEAPRAAKFALDICAQLDRLHSFLADIDGQRRAVVHGDIKPSNVQIGLNDEVRLLDFGIAKAITFTHSRTNHNFGSPSYCSPERLSRAQVDHQADLWAVGVTLYEMVAGSPPYQAQSTRKLETLIQSRRPPRALPETCPPRLKAIINKALAGDLHLRYVSAAALRDDLQLYLQDRPTAAEKQNRIGWDTNATVEKPQPDRITIDKPAGRLVPSPPAARPASATPAPEKSARTRRIANVLSLVGALLWGLFAGFIVLGPAWYFYNLRRESTPLRITIDHSQRSAAEINADWDLYQQLKRRDRFPISLSPLNAAREVMRTSYLEAANGVIERYHNSTDPQIQNFDWTKAVVCLQHALEIEPNDKAARGKLALCQGYVDLEQAASEHDAGQKFLESAALLPRSPDPQLGLAYVSVYVEKNVGAALAKLHEAQRLGYQLGPREFAEEADGYRVRADEELAEARRLRGAADHQKALRLLELAQHDFARARELYEPILGFSNVTVAMQQIDDEDRDRREMDAVLRKPPPPPVKRRVVWRPRRWQ